MSSLRSASGQNEVPDISNVV
jgi:hypothetical protein